MLSHHFLLGVGNWVEIMSLLSSLIFQLRETAQEAVSEDPREEARLHAPALDLDDAILDFEPEHNAEIG